MPNNLPKVPVYLISANDELRKSGPADGLRTDMTDYRQTESVPECPKGAMYRTPPNRASGNVLFRRDCNGQIDIPEAVSKVKEAIVRVREGVVLNAAEECALSCIFPGVFHYLDPATASSMRGVHLRISAAEQMQIAFGVADHLSAEEEYRTSNHSR